jgi:DNA-binding CsgD family transcriptional regulator
VLTRLLKPGEERREGHSVFILIKDLNQNIERWANRLKSSFDLSPREIECVVLLTERRDVEEIAAVMEISIETVRQYIKSMFKKMDVRKQHELVSLALEYRRNR